MAELADALDSGSSRGSPVEVQVLLPAPPKSLENSVLSGDASPKYSGSLPTC